jgi:hypothetical protein
MYDPHGNVMTVCTRSSTIRCVDMTFEASIASETIIKLVGSKSRGLPTPGYISSVPFREHSPAQEECRRDIVGGSTNNISSYLEDRLSSLGPP